MSTVSVFEPGGYRYVPGVFQYSGGVAAEPGHEIERARLAHPVPLAAGFDLIERHLEALGRPTTAFCACELRSPRPFSERGFVEFNREYVRTLERWGIFRDDDNPVARTNVCPEHDEPPEPMLYAFSYTVPARTARGSFVIAGSGEADERDGSFEGRIVRPGDRSVEGMREKMRYVLAEMERRLAALGFGWSDTSAVHAYTVYDIGPLVGDEVARRGAATSGLAWFFCRPPVESLDYEMDVRGPAREVLI